MMDRIIFFLIVGGLFMSVYFSSSWIYKKKNKNNYDEKNNEADNKTKYDK